MCHREFFPRLLHAIESGHKQRPADVVFVFWHYETNQRRPAKRHTSFPAHTRRFPHHFLGKPTPPRPPHKHARVGGKPQSSRLFSLLRHKRSFSILLYSNFRRARRALCKYPSEPIKITPVPPDPPSQQIAHSRCPVSMKPNVPFVHQVAPAYLDGEPTVPFDLLPACGARPLAILRPDTHAPSTPRKQGMEQVSFWGHVSCPPTS